MKKLPETAQLIEVVNEGFVSLLGKPVEIRCNVYIYCGILVGVNDTCVKLDNAHIVYETCAHNAPVYRDAQPIGNGQFVQLGLIESFGPTFKKF